MPALQENQGYITIILNGSPTFYGPYETVPNSTQKMWVAPALTFWFNEDLSTAGDYAVGIMVFATLTNTLTLAVKNVFEDPKMDVTTGTNK